MSPKRTTALKVKLNTASISDLGCAEIQGKARFVSQGKTKRSQASIEIQEAINTTVNFEQSKIKRAKPLVLKAKSLNGIDTSYKNIESLYTEGHSKVQKKLQKELMALKIKKPEDVDQERLAFVQSTILKYSTFSQKNPLESIPPSKYELTLIAKEMGFVMSQTNCTDAIFTAQKSSSKAANFDLKLMIQWLCDNIAKFRKVGHEGNNFRS